MKITKYKGFEIITSYDPQGIYYFFKNKGFKSLSACKKYIDEYYIFKK